MQESELFPCGDRVHMPSVQKSADKKCTVSATSPRDCSKDVQSLGHRNQQNTTRKLKTQLSELGKTLAFSDDVVSTMSPQSVSYSKAKNGMRTLFKPKNMQIGIGASKGSTETAGRHNCRGEPKKHLPCHLRISPIDKPPEYSYLQSLCPESSDTSVRLRTTQEAPAFKGAMMVPQSQSLPWTEQTLQKLSSSTAVRLGDNRSRREPNDSGILPRKSSDLISNGTAMSLHFERKQSSLDFKLDQQLDQEISGSPPRKDYLSQLESGAKPVYQKDGDETAIVLDNQTRFEKVLQTTYPDQPGDWCKSDGVADGDSGGGGTVAEFSRGYRKWLDFPQPCRTPEDLQWVCQSIEADQYTSDEDIQQSCDVSPEHSTQSIANREFFDVIHEWSSKWHIHLRLKDIQNGSSCILEDLSNLCDNTRKLAIIYITLLAENELKKTSLKMSKSRLLVGSELSPSSQSMAVSVAPEHVAGLVRCLDDPVEHVRVPAAVALYCMDKQSAKAEEVLLASVESPSPPDSWASVQCLALAGVCPAPVISKLITHLVDTHLVDTHQPKRRDKAADLLARSSARTGLVHAMLAEQLNCTGWQERLAACHMLPRLHRGVNKDLCSKLVVLVWEDWSADVRQASAQALGLTGNGKLIHDEIVERLNSNSEIVKLDALKKLHSLHLMTSKLLPAYLLCFDDPHISIRTEAVAVAGSLQLDDSRVLHKLHQLLRDPCWKVKAHTLKALGAIGQSDEALVCQLLWAVRFEKLAAIRAQACCTIATLQLGANEKVVKTLQDILIVDDDPLVQREAMQTLRQLGSEVASEDDMLDAIKSEVKRLGTQHTITSEILGLERTDVSGYVIEARPQVNISTRDYLNEKHRSRQYSAITGAVHSSGKPSPAAQRVPDGQTRKSWSPDRKTIDTQLSIMRKKCHNGATS